MLSKVNVTPAMPYGRALVAKATGQGFESIQLDPVYKKIGNTPCAVDGVTAPGATAPAAQACAPPGDGSCASVNVLCVKHAGTAECSCTGSRGQPHAATSGTAAPIGWNNVLPKAADATPGPGTPMFPDPSEAQPFASRIFSAASLSKVTPFSSSRVSNSPDRVISVMMSHPPTNSPLT